MPLFAAIICTILGYALGHAVGSATDDVDWRGICGFERDHRRRLWALFRRQREIDALSPAAWKHEQHEIDRLARVLEEEEKLTGKAQL